jgi:GNAT superfamily N-acetyltransferase
MADATVVQVSETDGPVATATLELAFASDPVMRWFWPSPSGYRATFSSFVAAVAGRSFELGTAFWTEAGRAVALWLPPGIEPDGDVLGQLMVDTVAPELLGDLAAFADLVQAHHPDVEHWYLPFTGVDPFSQGRGYGSILLAHALAECDRAGLPSYLEASTARSRALYERFGFRVVAGLQTGTSPTVWAMLRDPLEPAAN